MGTIQDVNFGLEEWGCRDHGLWPPAAYLKVMFELSKWQMALEFLNYPFARYELDHFRHGHPWLAPGGSWVETGDGPLLSAVYLYNVVRSSWR